MAASHAEQLVTSEDPHEQAWNEFHEAWRLPEENHAEVAAALDEALVKVKANCLDPAVAKHLDVGADYYRWLLLAKRGDQLPPSLALRQLPSYDQVTQPPQYVVAVHPENPAAAYGATGAIDSFTELAREELLPIFEYTLTATSGMDGEHTLPKGPKARYEALVHVMETSPVYDFLQSFSQPANNTDQRELTPLEKRVREVTINRQVRQRHGLKDTDHVPFRSQADLEIRKAVAQLDDEKVAGKAEKVVTPAERARDYFVKKAIDIYGRKSQEVVRVDYDEIGRPSFIIANQKSDLNDRTQREEKFTGLADAIAWEVALETQYEIGSKSSLGTGFDREVVEKVLSNLNTKVAWEDTVAFAVDTVAQQNMHYLSYDAMCKFMRRTNGVEERRHNITNSPYLAQILDAQGPVFSSDIFSDNVMLPGAGERADSLWHSGEPRVFSKSEAERLVKQTEATVVRSPEAAKDTTARLVIIGGKLPELPLRAAMYDLQLTFEGGQFQNVQVPGYEIVAADRKAGMVQFVKSTLDPYEMPDVSLDAMSKAQLTDYYQEQALTGLTGGIQRDPLTLREVIDNIRDNSDYTYDAQYDLMPFGTDIPHVNGYPQIQCTGAAYLLSRSVYHSFKHEYDAYDPFVTVIDGLVLNPGSNRVSAMGHRQVRMRRGDRSYVLDATPYGDMAIEQETDSMAAKSGRKKKFMNRFRRKKGLTAVVEEPQDIESDKSPQKEPDASVAETDMEPHEAPKPKYESVTAQREAERRTPAELRTMLERQLLATFHAPNTDVLMKQLLTLPKDDPARRTLSVAIQSTREEGVSDDLTVLKTYLTNYSNLTPALRRQYRLNSYNEQTLQMLSKYVDELSTTIVQ